MDTLSVAMLAGILVGLAVAIAIIAILLKKRALDLTFDERQERARGVAFKRGFFTLMVCVAAYGMLDMTIGPWCDAMAGCTLCICIALTVFAITCIRRDAYLSLNEKPKQFITLITFLAAFNLGIATMYIMHGELLEDGVLTFRVCNLLAGVMALVILAVYLAKYLSDRGSEEGAE